MNNKQILLLMVLALLIGISACDRKVEPDPPDEEFRGIYLVRDLNLVDDLKKEDSVTFLIRKNTFYSMLFYSSTGDPNAVHFCDLEGTLIDFGTPKVSFDPTLIYYSNCDTIRIPRGLFEADFRNHGDTVYVFKRIDADTLGYDSLYQMKLLKVK